MGGGGGRGRGEEEEEEVDRRAGGMDDGGVKPMLHVCASEGVGKNVGAAEAYL